MELANLLWLFHNESNEKGAGLCAMHHIELCATSSNMLTAVECANCPLQHRTGAYAPKTHILDHITGKSI